MIKNKLPTQLNMYLYSENQYIIGYETIWTLQHHDESQREANLDDELHHEVGHETENQVEVGREMVNLHEVGHKNLLILFDKIVCNEWSNES